MSSHILLLNCGSSSMKYQLFDPETQSPLAVGIVDGATDIREAFRSRG